MRRSFEALRRFRPDWTSARDPKFIMRAVIGALLVLNVIAIWFVISPPGGSAEELEMRLTTMKSQFTQRKAALAKAADHASKVETSHQASQQFESQYFTSRRIASSTFVSELNKAAKDSGIKPKEHLFLFESIEGSDVIDMMTITANYEGTYPDLLHFISNLDRSSKFLILDTLGATPQQGTGMLNVTVKLNAFVKEDQQQP